MWPRSTERFTYLHMENIGTGEREAEVDFTTKLTIDTCLL